MTDPEHTPRDFTPYMIAVLAIVAVTLLVVFFVRFGGDLLGFIVQIRAWMSGEGPHL